MTYRLGTRGSALAKAQAAFVQARLAAALPADSFELVCLSSKGDREPASPLPALGAGAFVRDLEAHLLANDVDLLVHSMKDLPAALPDGLVLAKAWTRGDPRDVLVSRTGARLEALPPGAVVATGSVRRTRFLAARRSDLVVVPLRGNVDTRLRKLFAPAAGERRLDAIILAAAGLLRLGRADVITEYLDPSWMIPAPNQGQLAIELRAADLELRAKVDALGDDASERVASAERAFLRETGATCRDAVAAYAEIVGGELKLRSFYEPAR